MRVCCPTTLQKASLSRFRSGGDFYYKTTMSYKNMIQIIQRARSEHSVLDTVQETKQGDWWILALVLEVPSSSRISCTCRANSSSCRRASASSARLSSSRAAISSAVNLCVAGRLPYWPSATPDISLGARELGRPNNPESSSDAWFRF